MDLIWTVLFVTALAGVVGTGAGGVIAAVVRKNSTSVVSLLLSFAGGIMLGVVCFDLIAGAILPEGAAEPINVFVVVGGVALGYVVVWLLNLAIDRSTGKDIVQPEGHPTTADDLDELIHSDHYHHHRREAKMHLGSNSQLFVAGIVMAAAIALHNVPEGMVIGASFAKGAYSHSDTGLIMAAVIGLHNIPEGMAVAVPLIAGGSKKSKAILTAALSGASTVLGALPGYWLGALSPIWMCLSLSFAAGAMLYVVFGELLPESILMLRSKAPAFASLVGILLGLVLVNI